MTFCGLITPAPQFPKIIVGNHGDINIIKGSVITKRVFALPFSYKIFVAM